MKKKIASEHEEQVCFVGWFKSKFPDYTIFAIPNGGGRSKREGKRLKDEGVKKGVFDLQVITPNGDVFFIEMKRADQAGKKNGGLSDDQVSFGKSLDLIGLKWYVGYGATDSSIKCLKIMESLARKDIKLTSDS